MAETWDVFISYGHQDAEWVGELAANLHRGGFNVFLDIWELVGGDSLIIERAPARLSESRARGQWRRSLSAGSSLRSRREMAQTRPSPSHST